MKVRQKFWGFFGVFTEDSRKLVMKDRPSQQWVSQSPPPSKP
jgi:hypothetical protein